MTPAIDAFTLPPPLYCRFFRYAFAMPLSLRHAAAIFFTTLRRRLFSRAAAAAIISPFSAFEFAATPMPPLP
jgi:hypothetical protein